MKGLNVLEYDLKGVKGKICTIKEVRILPFVTTKVKGITNLMTNSKWLECSCLASYRIFGSYCQGQILLEY